MNDSIKSSDCGRLQAVGVDFRNDETLSRLIQYLTNSQHLTLTGSPTITEDGHALISFCNDEGLPASETLRLLSQEKHQINGHDVFLSALSETCNWTRSPSDKQPTASGCFSSLGRGRGILGMPRQGVTTVGHKSLDPQSFKSFVAASDSQYSSRTLSTSWQTLPEPASEKVVPNDGPNVIRIQGLPQNASQEQVKALILENIKATKSVNVNFWIAQWIQDDVRIYFEDIQAIISLWKRRHLRPLEYDSHKLYWDVMVAETNADDRFLVGNLPPDISKYTLSLHLKSAFCLANVEVTLVFCFDKQEAVVFLTDSIVDERLLEDLSSEVGDYESADGSATTLNFEMIPQTRTVELSGLDSTVHKGIIRNYFQVLQQNKSVAQPLLIEEIRTTGGGLPDGHALIKFRTVEAVSSIMKLPQLPEIGELKSRPEARLYHTYPSTAFEQSPEDDSRKENKDKETQNIEYKPESPDLLNYVFQNNKHKKKLLAALKCDDVGSDGSTITITGSPYSRDDCIKNAELFFDGYVVQSLKIRDARLWQEAIHLIETERESRQSEVTCYPLEDEIAVKFVGPEIEIQSLYQFCANAIGNKRVKLEEDSKETRDTLSCASIHQFQLLESSDMYKSATVKCHIDRRNVGHAVVLNLRGPNNNVRSAKESLVQFIAGLETVFVDLSTPILQYLQDFGFDVLMKAYKTDNIQAIPASIEDSGVRIVTLVSSRQEVTKVTKETFAHEIMSGLEDEEVQKYLRTSDCAGVMKSLSKAECSVLLQTSQNVLGESGKHLSVAVVGEKSSVRDTINAMSDHLAYAVLYERRLIIDHPGTFRYLQEFTNPQLTQLSSKFSQYRAHIILHRPTLSNGWQRSVVHCCTKAGLMQLKQQVESLISPFKVDKTITRHGVVKYFRSDSFATVRSRIERSMKLVIYLDCEEDSNDCNLEDTEPMSPVVLPSEVVQNTRPSTKIAEYICKKQPHKKIALFIGNICEHKADAIVNAANEHLDHGLGVAKAIAQSAGPLVQKQSEDYIKQHGKLKIGTAMYTSAGALSSAKHVIHTVGPQWPGKYHLPGTIKKTEEKLRSAVKSSLEKAQTLGCNSLCFPAISSGRFGCPSDFVAKQMVKAALDFLVSSDSTVVSEIHFILLQNDTDNVRCFKRELQMTADLSPCEDPYSIESSLSAFHEDLVPISTTRSIAPRAERIHSNFDSNVSKTKRKIPELSASKSTDVPTNFVIHTDVVSGDITKSKADVIVNSTNGSLELDSALASKAVSKSAGSQLQLDCNDYVKNKGKLKTGDMAVTAGHKLLCKNVFHVVCPNSRKGLSDLVTKCLTEADNLKMKSVALPALGTGNLGMSDADAAAGIFDAISTFSCHRKMTNVIKVEVVIYDQAKMSTFKEEHQKRISSNPSLVDVRDDSEDNAIRLQNGLVVSLDNGDVTKSNSDVIVAPTGVVLNSVVTNAPKVNEELKASYGGVPKPVADLSSGGVLLSKRVFAISVPSKGQRDDTDSIKCIRDVVKQCLDMANRRGCVSISIPAIGTGGLGYSNVQAAAAIAEAAKEFSINVANPALKQIRVSIFDAHRVSDFQKEIRSRLAGTSGGGFMSFVASGVYSGVTSGLKSVGAAVTSVFNTDERKEIYSSTKDKTPVKTQPLKSFSFGEPDVVSMSVIGIGQDVCSEAVSLVEESIDKYCVTKTEPIEHDVPSDYADSMKQLAAKYEVALKVDISQGSESTATVTLAGYQDDVREVQTRLLRLLNKAVKEAKDANDRHRILSACVWYRQNDDGSTEHFTQDEIVKLELARESNKTIVNLVQGGNDIEIDLLKMEQKVGSKITKITRKEKAAAFQFPSTWTSTGGEHEYELHRQKLKPSDDEYKDVAKMFSDTGGQGTVVTIERVQNPRLYMSYIQEKQALTKRRQVQIQAKSACVDRRLFHGTKPESVLHILTCGFNRSYAGTVVGMIYGAGVYFASSARESCKYAVAPADGNRQMLLCDVLLGMSTVGHKGQLEPPVINDKISATDRYDSTVNNVSNPTIFVSCYRDSMAYPTYVITFK